MAAVAVLAVSCAILLPVVRADMASTYAMTELLDWETDSQMQMSISASDGDDMLPLSMLFTVIPLTTDLGLNESQLDRGVRRVPSKVVVHQALAPHLPPSIFCSFPTSIATTTLELARLRLTCNF